MKLNVIGLLSVLLLPLCLNGQSKELKLEYWGNPQKYLNTQAEVMLDLVDSTLNVNRPSTRFSLERKLALYGLDAVVHEVANDDSEALHNFINKRVGRVIADLAKPMRKGLRIYKIYNDGFIVRTPKCVVAIDLCSAQGNRCFVPVDLMKELVNHCEALFITHKHGDHADDSVVTEFLATGKPVYAVDEYCPDNMRINHVRSENVVDTLLSASAGRKLKVTIFPGHQDELQNNDYVITMPEGYIVAHLGDQYNKSDMEWITDAHKMFKKPIDVLIVDCWINDMEKVIGGFAPKTVITGHENEMGHSIDHREAFWLTYYKMERLASKVPYVIMGWGEWWDFEYPQVRKR